MFSLMFGAVLGAFGLRSLLPEHHLSNESRDAVRVGFALIATLTALVLGLVISSAKNSFDTLNAAIRHSAADVLSLDRALARYGPETAEVRAELRRAVAHRVEMIWPADGARRATLDPFESARPVEELVEKIRSLPPKTESQQWYRARALALSEALLDARWSVFAGLNASIPVPFLATLGIWLTIAFMSFALFAPRNATVLVAFSMCALSVAGAVFLVLEMDMPFEGFISVSPDPLRFALEHLNR